MKREIKQEENVLKEIHQKREELKLKISKLTYTIDMLEQNQLGICKSYDAANQERKKR